MSGAAITLTRRRLLRACPVLLGAPLLAACGGAARALPREDEPRAATSAPARWALALSGGGLRGFAHLGVLRALQRLGLEPDLVVGSSVGAVIGGLYASGVHLDAVERLALAPEMDPWSSLLVSPESRSAGLGAFLRAMLAQQRIDDFPRRFVAVATARDSGEVCCFGSGDAACAILASAALPGALAPVTIGEREYVDGGLSQPLPVRVARALGAQQVIAVDVGFHPEVPAPSGRIGSVFHAGFLMARNLSAPDRALADGLIEPVLPPVPEITLARRGALIDCGERAALALAPALRAAFEAPLLAAGAVR
jgi:NTE family protein